MQVGLHVLLAAVLGCLAVRAEPLAALDPEAALRQVEQAPANPVFLEQLRQCMPAMTNARQREVSLAVYGLGCLINEETTRAQQAHDVLLREFPDSPTLAFFKAEPLYTSCPRCGGDGTLKREPCDDCKGSRRCPICGGKGRLKALSGTASCSACSGTGRCRACEGTGRKEGDCPRCHGKGRVLDHDEIRRTSYGLIQQYFHPDGAREPRRAPGEGRRKAAP